MSDLSQTKEKLFGKAKTMPVWKRAACAAGVAAVGFALWWAVSASPEKVSYMTKPVQTGDLIVTVSVEIFFPFKKRLMIGIKVNL